MLNRRSLFSVAAGAVASVFAPAVAEDPIPTTSDIVRDMFNRTYGAEYDGAYPPAYAVTNRYWESA